MTLQQVQMKILVKLFFPDLKTWRQYHRGGKKANIRG